jgi:hypothetical protein
MSAHVLGARNRDLLSIASPEEDIRFDHAVGLWSSFYVRIFDVNPNSMSSNEIAATIRHSCKLFGIRFSWAVRKNGDWFFQTLQ